MPIEGWGGYRHHTANAGYLLRILALAVLALSLAPRPTVPGSLPPFAAIADPVALVSQRPGAPARPRATSGSATGVNAGPTRIMPLGDSITHGGDVPGGYRTTLWQQLTAEGHAVDFVGSQSAGPENLGDRDHEGHPGWCIQPIASSIPGWLATYQPDIVLLLIGTNDLYRFNYPPDPHPTCDYNAAAGRLSSLLDTIAVESPTTHVIVGTLPPQDDPISNDRVRAFNAAIPGMVSSKVAQGSWISYVDLYGALTLADLADDVHPNDAGYRKIAQVWHGALRELLSRCVPGIADVPDDHPACAAIAALVAQDIIRGYATTPPTFGPDDPVQRAQMTAFLVRALQWQGMPTGPKSFTDFGQLVGELRDASLILANTCDPQGNCAANGYEPAACAARGRTPPCFGPNDQVTYAQVISFVARAFAFDATYDWQPQPNEGHPYSGVPAVHDVDVRTYHFYAGAIPDAPTTPQGWSQPAPRAWIARVLYLALQTAP